MIYLFLEDRETNFRKGMKNREDMSPTTEDILERIKESNKNVKDEDFGKETMDQFHNIIKDFPQIATQAIINFAKSNGFKKIFWHTYESGQKLKQNAPPKSLYNQVPKENFFVPSQEKPFDLSGDFFEREASIVKKLEKLARRLLIKNIGRLRKL
jgi:hypothetical protein